MKSLLAYLPVVTALLSAAGLWITTQRYRRELPSKRLSYSTQSADQMVEIRVWNSGNTTIEPDDYISSVGFAFGADASMRQEQIQVTDEVPWDLGVKVQVPDPKKLEIPKIYLNPNDRFTVQVRSAEALDLPKPYGRIEGTHQLFRQERGKAEDLAWKYIIFAFITVFAISIGVLILITFLDAGQGILRTLLTVVTTLAGILAGFISGRTSILGPRD